MNNFLTVKKEILRKIIVLVDEGETLSEQLEKNNQELRLLTYSLIKETKQTNQVISLKKELLTYKKNKGIKQ